MKTVLSLFLCIFLVGCASINSYRDKSASFGSSLDKTIIIEGLALNFKAGPFLQIDEISKQGIWIDIPWYEWPQGSMVSATGKVIERYDMCVYIPKPNEPQRDAIEVPAGTDLKEASRRFWLTSVKWHKLQPNHAAQGTSRGRAAPDR